MGKPRLILACLAAAGLLLAVPAAALAATAPPGNSEVNQYAETLPGGKGDNTVNPPGTKGGGSGGGGGGRGSVVPAATQRQLNHLGRDGRAALGLANANAPSKPAGSVPGKGGNGGGSSAVGGVLGSLTGSEGGGMGALLPLILVGVAAMGIGYALARRRARPLG